MFFEQIDVRPSERACAKKARALRHHLEEKFAASQREAELMLPPPSLAAGDSSNAADSSYVSQDGRDDTSLGPMLIDNVATDRMNISQAGPSGQVGGFFMGSLLGTDIKLNFYMQDKLASAEKDNAGRSPMQVERSGDDNAKPNGAKLQPGRATEPDKKEVENKNKLMSSSDVPFTSPVKAATTPQASGVNSQGARHDDKTSASEGNSLQQQKAVPNKSQAAPNKPQSDVGIPRKSVEVVKENRILAQPSAPSTDSTGGASPRPKVSSQAGTPQGPGGNIQKVIPSGSPMKRPNPAGGVVGGKAGESRREKQVMKQMGSDTSPALKKVKMIPCVATTKNAEASKTKGGDGASKTALDRRDNNEGFVRHATQLATGGKRVWTANPLSKKRSESSENPESPHGRSQPPVLTPNNLPPMSKLSSLPAMSKFPSKLGRKTVKWRDGKEEGVAGEELR